MENEREKFKKLLEEFGKKKSQNNVYNQVSLVEGNKRNHKFSSKKITLESLAEKIKEKVKLDNDVKGIVEYKVSPLGGSGEFSVKADYNFLGHSAEQNLHCDTRKEVNEIFPTIIDNFSDCLKPYKTNYLGNDVTITFN